MQSNQKQTAQTWLEFREDQKPQDNQLVWYFFEQVGVFLGHFVEPSVFHSRHGFLNGDVTHWIPADNPQEPMESMSEVNSLKDLQVNRWYEFNFDKALLIEAEKHQLDFCVYNQDGTLEFEQFGRTTVLDINSSTVLKYRLQRPSKGGQWIKKPIEPKGIILFPKTPFLI